MESEEERKKEMEEVLNELEKDIQPIPQFSPEVTIMQIKYTPEEKRIMNIFRGVILSKLISLNVYKLTTIVIGFFPTNYAAWVIRRECINQLPEIKKEEEFKWLDDIIIINQKNYQIWHHRKLLIDKFEDVSHEKNVMDQVFKYEPKNFHAWSHRIWMIRRFNNTEGEFEFIDEMLRCDIKNNSAWNYRFFLVQYMNFKMEKNIVEQEIKYAMDKIKLTPVNECPYSYIRGYLKKYGYKFSDFSFIKEEIEKIVEKDEKNQYGLNLLLDIYEEEKSEKKYIETIEKLIKIDFIRKKYYNWRKQNSGFESTKSSD